MQRTQLALKRLPVWRVHHRLSHTQTVAQTHTTKRIRKTIEFKRWIIGRTAGGTAGGEVR